MLLQKVIGPIVPELNTSNHAYLNPNIHEFGQVHKLEHHELNNYAALIMSQHKKNGLHIKPCMIRANGSNIMGLCVKFLILERCTISDVCSTDWQKKDVAFLSDVGFL